MFLRIGSFFSQEDAKKHFSERNKIKQLLGRDAMEKIDSFELISTTKGSLISIVLLCVAVAFGYNP